MNQTSRRWLGWLPAVMLAFVIATPAWALDLDQEISRQDQEAARVLGTLGRHKGIQAKHAAGASAVKVKLLPSRKGRKRR